MYKPINGFTKEKILDVIRARPLDGPAIGPDKMTCVYLAPDGNKCGVGLFIPDGHASQSGALEVHSLLRTYPDLVDLLPLSAEGLRYLQAAHDAEAMSRSSFNGNAKAAMLDWVEKNVSDDAVEAA